MIKTTKEYKALRVDGSYFPVARTVIKIMSFIFKTKWKTITVNGNSGFSLKYDFERFLIRRTKKESNQIIRDYKEWIK